MTPTPVIEHFTSKRNASQDSLCASLNSESLLRLLDQIVLFATFGSLSYGYCTTIIASTLGHDTFLEYFHLVAGVDDNANALIGSTNGLFQAGGFFGALLIGPAADFFSRRGAIAISAGFLVIGGALQAASQNIAMFIIFRLVTGFGVGMTVGAVPLYQSEVSPPKSRGLLVGLHGNVTSLLMNSTN